MNDMPHYEEWIRQQAQSADLTLTSPIEAVKVSPTATILRVESNRGALFFKTIMPSFAFEAPLTAALAELYPDALPRLVAVDESHGWLLMHDAGVTLKQLMTQTAFDVERWIAMLRRFADLQQAATSHVLEFLKLGVPDRRLSQLPTLYESLLNAEDVANVLLLDQPDGITSAQLAELRTATPHLHDLCTQLASFDIPETLHHDDFHVGNVTLSNNQMIFIDWGESGIAHPFYSLMLSLRYAKLVFNCDDDRLDQLRDAYLERWTRYAPLPDLRRAFVIAAQLGALCRTLTWVQVSRGVSIADRAEYADAPPYWLLTFLRNTPLQA